MTKVCLVVKGFTQTINGRFLSPEKGEQKILEDDLAEKLEEEGKVKIIG